MQKTAENGWMCSFFDFLFNMFFVYVFFVSSFAKEWISKGSSSNALGSLSAQAAGSQLCKPLENHCRHAQHTEKQV